MHYYTHNFGDYSKDAGHLTTLQHGIYRLLMDHYYVTEEPIPVAKAARIARADKSEVDIVLGDFFELSDDGTVWRHKRIDQEIAAYREKAERNRANGMKGGRPARNPVGSSSDSDAEPKPKANRKPETGNQKNPPSPPAGGKRQRGSKSTLPAFVASLAGEPAFPPSDPILAYADEIGMPAVFLKMAWLEFQARTAESKTQVDWRATFRNYVRGNYLKLWYQDGDEWLLTTAGKQAWKTHMAEGDEL